MDQFERRPPVEVGGEYDVNIDSVGDKGDGIAKIDRFTIFVPGSQRGDRVTIRITKILSKYAFSEVIQNLTEENQGGETDGQEERN